MHEWNLYQLSKQPINAVLGFCFTITEMKVQEISFDYTIIENKFLNLMNYSDKTNVLMLLLKMVAFGGLILIMFLVKKYRKA